MQRHWSRDTSFCGHIRLETHEAWGHTVTAITILFMVYVNEVDTVTAQYYIIPCSGVLTVFAHHRFANQSDGGRIIPSSLFARLANQYFGINEQSVTNKSFRNTRLSGRLDNEP